MTNMGFVAENTFKLLRSLPEYRMWIDEHYSLDIFTPCDSEALLAELQPDEFPCIAMFIKAPSLEEIPVFIPALLLQQCLKA